MIDAMLGFWLGATVAWALAGFLHRREVRKLTNGYLLAANRMVDESTRKKTN